MSTPVSASVETFEEEFLSLSLSPEPSHAPPLSHDRSPPRRLYLDVGFNHKDECKRMGGRWDTFEKKWYVPPGTLPGPFLKLFRLADVPSPPLPQADGGETATTAGAHPYARLAAKASRYAELAKSFDSKAKAYLARALRSMDLAFVVRKRAGVMDEMSLLSVLFETHRSSSMEGFMRFFTMKEVRVFRTVSREFKESIEATIFDDLATIVSGDLALWRLSFPSASACNISSRMLHSSWTLRPLTTVATIKINGCTMINEHDFSLFARTKHLEMRGLSIGDAGLLHLESVVELDVTDCPRITDAGFAQMRHLEVLKMGGSPGISGSVFRHLRGLAELTIDESKEAPRGRRFGWGHVMPHVQRLVDFEQLRGLRSLTLLGIDHILPTSDSPASFLPLRALDTLVLRCAWGHGVEIDDYVLGHLAGLGSLELSGGQAPYDKITDFSLVRLIGLRSLVLTTATFAGLSVPGVSFLRGVESINAYQCYPRTLVDEMLRVLPTETVVEVGPDVPPRKLRKRLVYAPVV